MIRAKRAQRLPVILSPSEVQRIVERLSGTVRLMCLLLYGAGLRIMELVRLRTKDVDFDYHRLCMRDGKGGKDRYTLLPECIEEGLRHQVARVLELHQADLKVGFGTVYMPYALGRKWPLPETLHTRELRLLFDALPNPRDRFLAALLAGCGLRVSEACRVRWADLNAADATLHIEDPSGLRSRTVPVPQGLLPLFQGLAAISRASAPIVCGRSAANAAPCSLSVRQAERIVQKAGLRSGVLKRVTPTNLRSTYAHRRLLAGQNIREVQIAMGHRSVKTTFRYQACILPNVTSPLDPESQSTVIRQINILLGRLAMTFSAIQPTRPQGP